MCDCSPKTIIPIASGGAYWGYKHIDGNFMVKKFFGGNFQCDLCHAKEEKANGNDLIKWICPYPILATDNYHAAGIIQNIYLGILDETTWAPQPNEFSRFELLED